MLSFVAVVEKHILSGSGADNRNKSGTQKGHNDIVPEPEILVMLNDQSPVSSHQISLSSESTSESENYLSGMSDNASRQEIFTEIYPQVVRIARGKLNSFSALSLSLREVVNESYLKFINAANWHSTGKEHLYAQFAVMIRHIILDHLKTKRMQRVDIEPDLFPQTEQMAGGTTDLQAIIEALEQLEKRDEKTAMVVNLRFFVGLTEAECAQTLNIAECTVTRKWKLAKSWLYKHIETQHE